MDNTPAPISPTPVQPAVSSLPDESPNRRWFLWLIGGVALLIFGVAIGLFSAKFFGQPQSPSQLTLIPTPTLSLTPSLVPDPTANWKTYSNTTYKFEFKYHNNWLLVEDSASRIRIFDNPNNKEPGNLYNVELVVDSPSAARNINPNDPIGTKKTIAEGVVKEKVENIKLGDLPASKSNVTVSSQSGTDAVPHTVVETKIDSRFLILRFIPGDSKNFQQGFDLILSTFHFLK